jgi:putative copper export protein
MNTPTSLRSTVMPWLVGSALVSVVVLVVVLDAGGGAPQPSPAGLPDAGPVTGWGVPVVRLLVDLAGFITVGMALIASHVIDVNPVAGDEALPAAGSAAAIWGGLAVLQSLLFVSEAQAEPLLSADLGSLRNLLDTLGQSSEAKAMLVQAALAASVAFAAGLSRTHTGAAATLALALAAFLPQALIGHAATGNRLLGSTTLFLHVGAAALWVGGLAALAWAALHGRVPLANAVPRYSALALWCVVAVAVSGALNAWVRIGSFPALLESAYGEIVLAKTVALGVLAGFGWLHRQHTVELLRTWRRRRDIPAAASLFVGLAAIELAVMAATVALAVGLSRTPTPATDGVEGARSVGPVAGRLVAGATDGQASASAGSSTAVTTRRASQSTR